MYGSLILAVAHFVFLIVLMTLGHIFAKRIFLPSLEDYVESRKKARYTAL